jgi:hypothetical protein
MIKKLSYSVFFSLLIANIQAQIYTKNALQKIQGNCTLEVLQYNGTDLVSKEEIKSNQKKDWQICFTENNVNIDGSIDVSASFKLIISPYASLPPN